VQTDGALKPVDQLAQAGKGGGLVVAAGKVARTRSDGIPDGVVRMASRGFADGGCGAAAKLVVGQRRTTEADEVEAGGEEVVSDKVVERRQGACGQ